MQVRQLMKPSPECVNRDDTLETAARRMKQINCGILPVIEADSKAPVGVITDRDIVLRCIANGESPAQLRVDECCTSPAICCDTDCTAEDAFHTMREHKIGRLLVLDERGNLTGIISMADIIARVPKEIWSQLPGATGARPRKAA